MQTLKSRGGQVLTNRFGYFVSGSIIIAKYDMIQKTIGLFTYHKVAIVCTELYFVTHTNGI